MSFDWKDDNSQIFMATATNAVKAWDLAGNRVADIGQHQAPVKDVFYVKDMNQCVVSSGWDGFVKVWDTRSPNPVIEANFG